MGTYDAIIAGGGPGGATAAAFMAREGLRVLLVDKSKFPRDKVCGDAISGKSVDVLQRLGIIDEVMAADQIGSWGVTFGGPFGSEVAIPFTKDHDRPVPPGFVCARTVFDDVVFQAAVNSGADIREETAITGLTREGERVTGARIKTKGGAEECISAPLVVGADGAYSAVARALDMPQLNEKHYCAGLRVYYKGVTGFHAHNHVELHFIDDANPGYFWIFPMPGGRANVGIGMLSRVVKKRSIKLKALLQKCIDHPRFRDRFSSAEAVSPVKGWGLPLGSQTRPMAGAGWMLVGDAASLIDPFTGEGIGNAMISGERAAGQAFLSHQQNDFSSAIMQDYQSAVLSYLQGELRLSYGMQRLARWKALLSLVIRKASRSPELADTISCMFDDEGQRRRLLSPLFYLRVLMA